MVSAKGRSKKRKPLHRKREVVQPNFKLTERAAGILLHVTSLPGPHGNGDLGPEARNLVDFLARAGQRWWQMLPVNPVGPGYSPYSGVSAFAGSGLLISLHDLVEDGLLDESDVALSLNERVADYAASSELRSVALRRAHERFRERRARYAEALSAFRLRARFWLDDYCLFMALKQASGGAGWTHWEHDLARYDATALQKARHAHADAVSFYEFEQFMFDRQWRALRTYAAARGVGLIGDAPIFVAHDSSDVWGNQASFRLDAHGEPTVVSGVPPDYFSQTGQRWGTPLYRWKALKRGGYRFWIERFRMLMERFDVIRLDHFIGFARYWEIPASEPTAVKGRWMKGPGRDLFDEACRRLGVLPFIAEDLGSVTPRVRALRDHYRMPGMRVLQFAFGGGADNEFLPHHYVRDCVAYTGTHDNDTTVGWFEDRGGAGGPRTVSQATRERKSALRYLRGPAETDASAEIHWLMLRAIYGSVANTAIVPMQDVLGLGSAARMNTPGVASGNWAWRMDARALSRDLATRLRAFSEVYGRCRAIAEQNK